MSCCSASRPIHNMLLLLLCVVLIPGSLQQCLTHSDSMRKLSDKSHESLLRSELQFSADFVRTVGTNMAGNNMFFSPSSVFNALLLTYFMSASQTETNLKRALHLDAKEDKLDVFGAYNTERYYQKLRKISEKSNQLNNANHIFYAKNVKIQKCMKVLLGEDTSQVNFVRNLKGVVIRINKWVAEQTRNVIQDFLSEGTLDPNVELVLVNAIYFKGTWKYEFYPEDTSEQDFYLADGSVAKITMMRQQNAFKYRVDETLNAEVLELPYVGETVGMYVLLPLEQSPSAIQNLLKKVNDKSVQDMVKAVNATYPENVEIAIPKFTVEETLPLTPILEAMGLGDLFTTSANFSTFSKSIKFGFSDAIHKAKIQVDEKGSEAAAATAFIVSRMGVPSFIANRPFVYMIYDKMSNIMLFFGVFSSPN